MAVLPAAPPRRILSVVLAVAFFHALFYLAYFPPWQHYDEPTHFEYVRLLAEWKRLPRPGEYDLAVRQEIAASMWQNGLWLDSVPADIRLSSDQAPWIGYSELRHPPLYYALLALPQQLVARHSVESQLYVARFCSILLGLVVVAAAYGLVQEAFPGRRWLPAAVAAFIALLPTFADLASRVNNDVGAAAVATLLLWASVRLVRRGPSVRRAGGVLALAGLCLLTKSTAALVAWSVLAALGAIWIYKQHKRWLWIGLAVAVLVALAVTLTWGDHAAHWYSYARSGAANRAQVDTPLGRAALALSANGQHHPRILFQELPVPDGERLRGHVVTLGAWFKTGEQGSKSALLAVDDGLTRHSQPVDIAAEWQFRAITATIGADAPGVAVKIVLPGDESRTQPVYVDGVVLVDGELPLDEAPTFGTSQAAAGDWAGRPVVNLLHNGSAERSWIGLRPWLGNKGLYGLSLLPVVYSMWEWPRTGWFYKFELQYLFHSFWGALGWGTLCLPAVWLRLVEGVTAAAGLGCVLGVVRRLRAGSLKGATLQLRAGVVLGVALLAVWGGTMLRVHPLFVTDFVFWPGARYAAVVLGPTTAALLWGLAELTPRRWRGRAAWLGLLALVCLDAAVLGLCLLPRFYG